MNTEMSPGLFRRFFCLLYEVVLLAAVWMFAALIFLLVFGDATIPPIRYFFQVYLWLITGGYFVWSWSRGGQTLAMQTWRIRLRRQNSGAVSVATAIRRYLLASLFFGVTFLWALFDREGLYLHDRLSVTCLDLIEKRG